MTPVCGSDASILVLRLLPVVVEPSAVAGDDDVVSLFSHVVLAGVDQSVDLGFALFLVVLQTETKRGQRDESCSV